MSDEALMRKKAVYYDQAVRAIEEMIKNEREWAQPIAEDMAFSLSDDVAYPYAFNRAADVMQRTTRLSVLHSVLGMMTRNFQEHSA